jgi:polyisoprenoid-binding protein YceI
MKFMMKLLAALAAGALILVSGSLVALESAAAYTVDSSVSSVSTYGR